MQKQWGKPVARKLSQRLMELKAAATLRDIPTNPPARRHELQGKLKGQFAVDLTHPHRLIFKPDHTPLPQKKDGGLDIDKVTKVVVIEVVNYH